MLNGPMIDESIIIQRRDCRTQTMVAYKLMVLTEKECSCWVEIVRCRGKIRSVGLCGKLEWVE